MAGVHLCCSRAPVSCPAPAAYPCIPHVLLQTIPIRAYHVYYSKPVPCILCKLHLYIVCVLYMHCIPYIVNIVYYPCIPYVLLAHTICTTPNLCLPYVLLAHTMCTTPNSCIPCIVYIVYYSHIPNPCIPYVLFHVWVWVYPCMPSILLQTIPNCILLCPHCILHY